MKALKGAYWLCLAGCLAACHGETEGGEEELLPKVTMVTALGGVGDNGYNDGILDGVMRAYEEGGFALSLVSPESMDEGRAVLRQWAEGDDGMRRELLVLASNDYEALAAEMEGKASDRRQILLFESRKEGLPEGVHTFFLRRYGAAYLAGCLARECPAAAVVAACPGDAVVEDAVEGFADGYAEQGGKEAGVTYLADDYTGYALPDEAYRVARELDERTFVFPLAGGSNNGIYKYSRDNMFSLLLVAGMDADCSAYSTRIPFSVVADMSGLVGKYLADWLAGEELPRHAEYGLGEAISIVSSPTFYTDMVAWEEYYEDPHYWEEAQDAYLPVALEREEAYYESK